jgi:hypothetical protein
MRFPFSDLHAFKDYVTFVQTYAPDRFRHREGASADEQWTLDLAFEGLREGLRMGVQEKGECSQFSACHSLVEEALDHYRGGRMREGFSKLEEVRKLLGRIPTK